MLEVLGEKCSEGVEVLGQGQLGWVVGGEERGGRGLLL